MQALPVDMGGVEAIAARLPPRVPQGRRKVEVGLIIAADNQAADRPLHAVQRQAGDGLRRRAHGGLLEERTRKMERWKDEMKEKDPDKPKVRQGQYGGG